MHADSVGKSQGQAISSTGQGNVESIQNKMLQASIPFLNKLSKNMLETGKGTLAAGASLVVIEKGGILAAKGVNFGMEYVRNLYRFTVGTAALVRLIGSIFLAASLAAHLQAEGVDPEVARSIGRAIVESNNLNISHPINSKTTPSFIETYESGSVQLAQFGFFLSAVGLMLMYGSLHLRETAKALKISESMG